MTGRQSYFRGCAVDGDPAGFLVPENQISTPWGDLDHGPSDKCGGEGTAEYRCPSCLERVADVDCPACHGRVNYDDVYPACEGDGEITRTTRQGVSVFPRSRARIGTWPSGPKLEGYVIVELEGELTGDRDLDADSGALLSRPSLVVSVHPLERERLAAIDAGVA